jgi:hypothetical protein
MYVLLIVVCPFVLFLLAIVLSVLGYMDSDCPFGIFKLFLNRDCHQVANINKTIASHFSW